MPEKVLMQRTYWFAIAELTWSEGGVGLSGWLCGVEASLVRALMCDSSLSLTILILNLLTDGLGVVQSGR